MTRACPKLVLWLGIVSVFFFFPHFVFAASAGPNSPGTMADDATTGTVAWVNVDNAKVSDDVYATAQSFCFIAGTKIKTATGEVSIESLRTDQYVLGFDMNQQIKNSRVEAVNSREVNEIVVVITSSGEVITTPEHPFYIGHGKFEEIQNINVGQYIYDSNFIPHPVLSKTTIHEKTVVYNLEVAGTHTYFANDFAVHNKSTWHYLKATNFGFSIPADSIVNGITAEVELNSNNGTGGTDDVRIVKGGTIGSTNKGVFNNNMPTSEAYQAYGSSSDLWSQTWTANDINNSNFGFAFSVSINAKTVFVDHMRITVSYTAPRTLYFNAAINNDWNNVNNWWNDAAFTQQASTIPNSADEVFISQTVSTNGGAAASVATSTFSGSAINQINLTVAHRATFNNSSANGSTGTITGTATFNDSSTNSGTVTSNADVYYPSSTPIGGTVNGTVTYYNYSTPTITVQAASSVTQTSAQLNGTLTASGPTVTVTGFNYGPTTDYGSTASTTGTFSLGAFAQIISGLSCNTTYHYQASASSLAGTTTIADETFITSPCAPILSTAVADSLSASGATVHSSITSTGGIDATQSGFAYGTSPTLTTTIATSTLGAQTGTASFSQIITSLSANTVYYARPYATNTNGTGYGSIISFTTASFIPTGGNGPIFTGNASDLFGYITPRMQTIYPDGRIVYFDTPAATPLPSNAATEKLIVVGQLSLGNKNAQVLNLQKYLNAHGYTLATYGPGSPGHETSTYGLVTRSAIMRFQKANDIIQTGIVGPLTRAALSK